MQALGGVLAVKAGATPRPARRRGRGRRVRLARRAPGRRDRSLPDPLDVGDARDLHRAARPRQRRRGRPDPDLRQHGRLDLDQPDDRSPGSRRGASWRSPRSPVLSCCSRRRDSGRSSRRSAAIVAPAGVVGVPVGRHLTVLFAASGALCGCAGALLAYSNASAQLNPGLQPLVLAACAAVLGGISLRGGRGSIWGLLLGALAVSLLAQVFAITKLPVSSTQIVLRRPPVDRGRRRRPGAAVGRGAAQGPPGLFSSQASPREAISGSTVDRWAALRGVPALARGAPLLRRHVRGRGADLRPGRRGERKVVGEVFHPGGIGWLPDGRMLAVASEDKQVFEVGAGRQRAVRRISPRSLRAGRTTCSSTARGAPTSATSATTSSPRSCARPG